jgi:Tfp pilus assembly protein PilF
MSLSSDRPAISLLQQALTHLAQGHTQAAIAAATQATALDDSLPLAFHILAKAHAHLEDTPAAIVAYKTAAAKYLAIPDHPNARRCIAAIEALQKPQPLQPTALYPSIAQQFLQQATHRLNNGDYPNALQDVQWLLELEPQHSQALCIFALLHAKMGNGQVATTAIARALEPDPTNPDLRFHRGLVRLALQDGFGAVQEFSDLLAQDAANAKLYLQRGHGYILMKDYDNAFKDASNAIAITPHPEAYALRASIHQSTQDFAAALNDYQQAASLWLNQGNWSHQEKIQTQIAIVQGLIHRQKVHQQESQGIRVPIKYSISGVPVIEVQFDGQYTFDMILDTGASQTLISGKMAMILGVEITGYRWGTLADGRSVRMETGQVRSIGVGKTESGTLHEVQVNIGDGEIDGLLGQNFLTHYNLRMMSDAIEFHPK